MLSKFFWVKAMRPCGHAAFLPGSQMFHVNAGDCYAIADEARYAVEHEVKASRDLGVNGQNSWLQVGFKRPQFVCRPMNRP